MMRASVPGGRVGTRATGLPLLPGGGTLRTWPTRIKLPLRRLAPCRAATLMPLRWAILLRLSPGRTV